MATKRRTKSKAPSEGWQNISLWESKSGNSAYSGNVQLSIEFLEIVIDAIENEEIELVERDGHDYIQLGVALRDNDGGSRNSPVFLGNIWIPETEDDEPKRRSSRKRRDESDDEDDDEPRSRRRRSSTTKEEGTRRRRR